MRKCLTIVIPTYNMQEYLRRCLDSLVIEESCFHQIEVLVINDGSTDMSSSIAHEYAERYPNVFYVIDKANGHYGSCINVGIMRATGKYFRILDADDWYDTDNFQSFVSFLQEIDEDMIISDFDMVNVDGQVIWSHKYSLPTSTMESIDSYPQLYDMWMHAITYKTEKLRSIHYVQQEGICYTDQEFIFQPMVAVKTIRSFPFSVYQYMIGRDGQTVNDDVWIKNIGHEIKSFEHRMQIFNNLSDYGLAKNYLMYRLMTIAEFTYKKALLDFHSNDFLSMEEFIACHSKWLYDELDKCTPRKDVRWKYIYWWRKLHYNSLLIFWWWRLLKLVNNPKKYLNKLLYK